MPRHEPGTLVLVLWEDACGVEPDWHNWGESHCKVATVWSSGFVVMDTQSEIELAPHVCKGSGGTQSVGNMAIPKRSVLHSEQINRLRINVTEAPDAPQP